ncbi:MAG: hypothetical protein AAF988_04275 [Pseudomonadota bacterium]
MRASTKSLARKMGIDPNELGKPMSFGAYELAGYIRFMAPKSHRLAVLNNGSKMLMREFNLSRRDANKFMRQMIVQSKISPLFPKHLVKHP